MIHKYDRERKENEKVLTRLHAVVRAMNGLLEKDWKLLESEETNTLLEQRKQVLKMILRRSRFT